MQGVKQSVCRSSSVCPSSPSKIARPWDLGIRVTRKHNRSVKTGKKNLLQCASNHFTRPKNIKSFSGHTHRLYPDHVLSIHAQNYYWVGRRYRLSTDTIVHSQTSTTCTTADAVLFSVLIDADAVCAVYALYRALVLETKPQLSRLSTEKLSRSKGGRGGQKM